MTYQRKESGKFGEELAVDLLESKGMKLIEKNYTCRIGEIDLIFRDGEILVFVEVKLRLNPYFGPAALAVTPHKQKKIINVVKYYLMERKLKSPVMRFDVVGIDNIDGVWTPTHYRNAFLAY